MIFYTYCQAIPEASRLLERLRSEKRVCGLDSRLVVHGGGPFHVDRLDPAERGAILDGIAEATELGESIIVVPAT